MNSYIDHSSQGVVGSYYPTPGSTNVVVDPHHHHHPHQHHAAAAAAAYRSFSPSSLSQQQSTYNNLSRTSNHHNSSTSSSSSAANDTSPTNSSYTDALSVVGGGGTTTSSFDTSDLNGPKDQCAFKTPDHSSSVSPSSSSSGWTTVPVVRPKDVGGYAGSCSYSAYHHQTWTVPDPTAVADYRTASALVDPYGTGLGRSPFDTGVYGHGASSCAQVTTNGEFWNHVHHVSTNILFCFLAGDNTLTALSGYTDPSSAFSTDGHNSNTYLHHHPHLNHHSVLHPHHQLHPHHPHHPHHPSARPGGLAASVTAAAPVPTYKWMQVKRNVPKPGWYSFHFSNCRHLSSSNITQKLLSYHVPSWLGYKWLLFSKDRQCFPSFPPFYWNVTKREWAWDRMSERSCQVHKSHWEDTVVCRLWRGWTHLPPLSHHIFFPWKGDNMISQQERRTQESLGQGQ